MKMTKKIMAFLIIAIAVLGMQITVYAQEISDYSEGTHKLNATLSCYVNAMGGVEFGEPLLQDAEVTIKDGEAKLTLYFDKSEVEIYTVVCDTFLDASKITGYYDKDGNLQTENVALTLSEEKVLNDAGEETSYMTSMIFPLDQIADTYELALYVNSNVMGSQFGTGDYQATLTVDWSGVPEVSEEPVEAEGEEEKSEVENEQEVRGNVEVGTVAIAVIVLAAAIVIVVIKRRLKRGR